MTANILEGGKGDLAIKGGKARFAYNDRQDPWHMLGNPVSAANTTIPTMMREADADYVVGLTRLIATDENGQPLYVGFDEEGRPNYVYIDNSRGTVRYDHDGTVSGLATVGTRYTVTQIADVMERAFAIVGAAQGDARVDTMGVLDEGRRFFATILLDGLVLDLPDGVTDEIDRFMGVETSFDGKISDTYDNGNIRRVCKNTCKMARKGARSTFKARHTVNGSKFLLEDARTALKISVAWSDAFKSMAEELAAVPATRTLLDQVIFDLWPVPGDDATDRQIDNHDEIVSTIRGLWANERNAATYGENGWTVYNAVGEYLDHYRNGAAKDRALTSMNPDSWVNKNKLRAQALILAGV